MRTSWRPGASARASTAPAQRRRELAGVVARGAGREPGAGHPPRLRGSPARRPAGGRARACPTRRKPPRSPTQQLAAPDRAVGAVAGAVEDRADGGARSRRARPGTPPGARGDAGPRPARTPSRSSAYLVDRYSGCRSWTTTSGSTANSRSKCSMPSRERAQRLVVLEVADVVGDPRALALGQAEGVLQLGAAGEQRRAACRPGSGRLAGHVAARAAQQQRSRARRRRRRRARPSRRCGSRSGGRARATGRRSRASRASASSSR